MSRTPPVVVFLVHGFAGVRGVWDEMIGELPDELHPVPLAVAGHEAPARLATSFTGEVDRLAGEVERRSAGGGDRRRFVVGYSLGGRLALAMTSRHPGLLDGAVLIGASAGLEDAEERRRRRASDEEWARRLERDGLAGFLDAWESQPLFATQRRLPAARRQMQRRLRARLEAAELAQAMRTLGLGAMPSYWLELAELELPVDLVVGEHDAKFAAVAERMAALLPAATLHAVPGAGHNVVLEAPLALCRIVEAATRRAPCAAGGAGRKPREAPR